MRKSFQCQIFVKISFIAVLLVMGCGAARTEDLPPAESAPTSTEPAKDTPLDASQWRHKPRPSYVTERMQERWNIAHLEARMRENVNGQPRVFFTTQKERDANETFSVYDTRDGYLINGRSIEAPSLYMRQMQVQYERGIAYGTREFIQLLDYTARAMHKKYPDTLMYLGNLGLRDGGDIPYSVSHNAGRDGDIAFYMKDENGKFYHPTNMSKMNRRFQSKVNPNITFDLEKNATLIEILLTQNVAPVQFIFVVRHLRSALRREFVARGASEDLLARFDATVMEQSAHDDHFHVRIYCSDADICAGCIDRSVIHPWHEDPVPKREACAEKHIKTLSAKRATAEDRAAALQRLALIGEAERAGGRILKFLNNEDTNVRAAAAMASASLGQSAVSALATRLGTEAESSVQLAIVDALVQNDSEQTAQALLNMLQRFARGELVYDPLLVQKIVRHITHHPRTLYVEPLFALGVASLLAPAQADLRLALEVVTNHISPEADAALAIAETQSWFEKNGTKTRSQWLIEGFKRNGFAVSGLQNADIPLLLDAIDSPHRAISINAQLTLKALSHLEQDSLDWSVSDARWHYTRFFKRRAKKYKIDLSDRDERGNKLSSP